MVQIQLSEGVLEGEELTNVLGGKYFSFKGVPYAAPPVGDLRFQSPQPVQPWSGIKHAKKHGSICCQLEEILKGSEDCLYLNVYSPDINPNKPLPVMFYIHGGGFMSGSGNTDLLGPDFLIKQGVVVVTFNYRLGVLGFLCLDTKEIPGNAGMKDQVAALRWVNKNISHFGGDPKNVTIFGESAGAASVSFHLVSPMSKGLFKRAIVQSGVLTNSWATAFEPRLHAETLAKSLGCKELDDKSLYEFFKSQPTANLIGKQVDVTRDEKCGHKVRLPFPIVDEQEFDGVERFFYGNPHEALLNNLDEGVEIMVGFTSDESVLLFSTDDQLMYNINTYLQYFLPCHMGYDLSMKKELEVAKLFKKHYLDSENAIINKENIDKALTFLSTDMFYYGIVQFAKTISKNNQNPIYFYNFSCHTERNVFKDLFKATDFVDGPKVSHCDDLMYLFNAELANVPFDVSKESFEAIMQTTKLWTNFAKFGNPTPDNSLGVSWLPFSLNKQNYLDIGLELRLLEEPVKEDMDLWEKITAKYLPEKIQTI